MSGDDDDFVTRRDFERAIRSLNATQLHNRDALLQLAARVIAAMPEVDEAEVRARLETIRIADLGGTRVALDIAQHGPEPEIPCAELIPLCGARCCTYVFALSTKELDEGVVRWDYGRPYIIRQRASDGFCVHNEPTGHGCGVHAKRPQTCRSYDCREDRRVWIDYEKRIPQPLGAPVPSSEMTFDLKERMLRREEAVRLERVAIDTTQQS